MAGTIAKNVALEKLRSQLEAIDSLRGKRGSAEFKTWHRNTRVLLENAFGRDSKAPSEFEEIRYFPMVVAMDGDVGPQNRAYERGLDSASAMLASCIEEVADYWPDSEALPDRPDAVATVQKICQRFHRVARQLQNRHANRHAHEVDDEYDVQDLLHALLKVDFDDVRAEEWCPSYAGAASRTDFLLADHGVFVEVKKTRKGLTDKQVGEQLIVDIGRYQVHPRCSALVCFVYDPEGRIGNPSGLMNDLSGAKDSLEVVVLVAPTGD